MATNTCDVTISEVLIHKFDPDTDSVPYIATGGIRSSIQHYLLQQGNIFLVVYGT